MALQTTRRSDNISFPQKPLSLAVSVSLAQLQVVNSRCLEQQFCHIYIKSLTDIFPYQTIFEFITVITIKQVFDKEGESVKLRLESEKDRRKTLVHDTVFCCNLTQC